MSTEGNPGGLGRSSAGGPAPWVGCCLSESRPDLQAGSLPSGPCLGSSSAPSQALTALLCVGGLACPPPPPCLEGCGWMSCNW